MSAWNNYEAPNAGLLFYKQIYREQDIKQKIKLKDGELTIDVPKDEKISPFDSFYKDLYEKSISKYKQLENPASPLSDRFTLFTTYPGLLVGSGYPHDTKAKGDFKIGFYFDHTSGQPVIPGSSVKGVLNSVFQIDVTEKGKNYTGEKSVEFVQWVLTEIGENETASSLTKEKLKQMQQEIFGDEDYPGRDVFFDAVINIAKTGDKLFLSNDFITPHENPLKNPNPIQFLKVLPGIGFEFRFMLNNGTLTAAKKQELFFKIITTLGLGAKTNVGYGQFSTEKPKVNVAAPSQEKQSEKSPKSTKYESKKETFESKSKIERQLEHATQTKITSVQVDENEFPEANIGMLNQKINATIIKITSGNISVKPHYKNSEIINLQGKTDKQEKEVIEIRLTNSIGSEKKGNLKFDRAKLV